ncbi:hypothetical protein [Aquabacterium sp.]|uniref:hypothetical protein n=1 Tax=Aquabacterium sp. TaxID=1872578 RepID=UPI0019BC4C10|nr:hypothetical protein [Aquabacterium sp.]MBC7701987.1 hypothetical protein [Aquabacterium sp.]
MPLNYLDFDHSEDTQGIGTFEAMASVGPGQVPAVHAEIVQVLAWAFEHFPDSHGPLSEGFEWDHDLQGQQEHSASESIVFDERSGLLVVMPDPPGIPRHTITLSISGLPDFCLAFRQRFELG